MVETRKCQFCGEELSYIYKPGMALVYDDAEHVAACELEVLRRLRDKLVSVATYAPPIHLMQELNGVVEQARELQKKQSEDDGR